MRRLRVIAFSGHSGSGKTTLLVKLIPALRARGLAVAALKRSGHAHPFDRPRKDSARLRRAGALAVALSGPHEVAYFGPPRSGIAALLDLLPPCDLVLAEGFKGEPVPRVEVHRSAVGGPFLCASDRHVVAVVSDERPPRALPWFGAGEVAALAEWIARFVRTGRPPARGERALAGTGKYAHRTAEGEGPQRETSMARNTSRGSSRGGRTSRRAAGRRSAATGSRRRTGAATVQEAGRKGGRRTLERRGPEFYSRIGRKGGKTSGGVRRAQAAARRREGGARKTTRRRSR